jgi:SAM-dependent methyltransferase
MPHSLPPGEKSPIEPGPRIIRTCDPLPCCDGEWEAAYLRFESEKEEVAKFRKRLARLGVDRLPRTLSVADLFCGRGGGIRALRELGFHDVVGVDLSEELLARFDGEETLYLADCRDLPFPDSSKDLIVVQGGLHHLPDLDADLPAVLAESHRVLRPLGRIAIVEPWNTPFLRAVHALSRSPLARKAWGRLDAFQVMYERERRTYDHWLRNRATVLSALERFFASEELEMSWGKLRYLGRRRSAPSKSVSSAAQ